MIIQIIQLSGTQVTCARFQKNGKSLVPVSGSRHPYHDHAELISLLREQLQPTTDEVRTILALPPALITLRELTLPILDRKKLRELLPLELSGETADEGPELVCDALPLADGALLVGWSAVPELADLLIFFAQIGLDPEVATCASLGWHLLTPPDQQEPIALVDDNALMVCSQGRPVFCRLMSTGTDTVARTLTALELGKGIRVKTIYRLEGDPLSGERKLPLPTQLSGQTASGDLAADALISPLSTALAYCSGEIFNLRSGPLAWTGKHSHLLRQFRVPIFLGSLVLLLLIAETGLRWYLLSRDLTSVNNSIASIYKGIFPARKKVVDETAEVKAELRRLQQGGATSDVLSFMDLLARAKDDLIQGFSEVEYDGERFRIKGDARSNAAVTALAQKLSAAGWIADQPEMTARPDGVTLFLIKGRRGGTTP
jgi:general secretion pathway protein L